jgi:thymidylate kinase
MIVILEGPDQAGKSTIGRKLAEALGFNYRGRITRLGPDKVIQGNEDDFTREGNWILDRCYWLSDYIYEPIFNGHQSTIATVDSGAYLKEGITYIFVTCTEETIVERMLERGDDLYTVDQIITAKQRYDKFFDEQWKRPYIKVDTTTGSVQEHVDYIINILRGISVCK